MRILLLTDGISPFVTGGMQRHSANLAKYLTLAGAKVTLAHCVNVQSELPTDDDVNKALFQNQEVKLTGIKTLHFPKNGRMIGHYVRNSYSYSKALYHLFDFTAFDFVYAKGFCGWYFIEQKKKGITLPPIGVKFHGYEMYQKVSSLSQLLKAKLLRRPTKWNNENADYIFSYGGKITRLIEKSFKISSKKIIEFPSGIDNDWLRQTQIEASNSVVKFVFVGRNEVRKGINELNTAICNLLKSTKFEFSFIGPIPDEAKIKDPNIIYYGELNSKREIINVLDKMDVLICPSHSEGMPNVILEAMARGLAVLATNVGAVEFIVDDNNGKIIEPLNQQELESGIMHFSSISKVDLLRMKKNSLEKIKNQYLWNQLAVAILHKITLESKIKREVE